MLSQQSDVSKGSTSSKKKRGRSSSQKKKREEIPQKKLKTYSIDESCSLVIVTQPNKIQLKHRIIKPVLSVVVTNNFREEVEYKIKVGIFNVDHQEIQPPEPDSPLVVDADPTSVETNGNNEKLLFKSLKIEIGNKHGACHIGFRLFARTKSLSPSDNDWQEVKGSPYLTDSAIFYTHINQITKGSPHQPKNNPNSPQITHVRLARKGRAIKIKGSKFSNSTLVILDGGKHVGLPRKVSEEGDKMLFYLPQITNDSMEVEEEESEKEDAATTHFRVIELFQPTPIEQLPQCNYIVSDKPE